MVEERERGTEQRDGSFSVSRSVFPRNEATDRPTSVMTRESVIGLVFSAAAASFAARQPPRHGHLLLITFPLLSFSTVHPLFRNQSQSLTGGPVGSPHGVPGRLGNNDVVTLPTFYSPDVMYVESS